MENQLTLHLKSFNNKVKVMNQIGAKDLTMTAADARNLQADVFELLAQIAGLTQIKQASTQEETIQVDMDGGSF